MKKKLYIYNLPDKTFIYRFTVIELMKRGYSFEKAKSLVKNSDLLQVADRCGWAMTHTDGPKEWADLVLQYYQAPVSKTVRYAV